MKKAKFLTAIVSLGAIAGTLPALVSCSCGKKEIEGKVNDTYVIKNKTGRVADIDATIGYTTVAGFILDSGYDLSKLQVEAKDVEGYTGKILTSINQVYDRLFSITLGFSSDNYLAIQQAKFNLVFSVDGQVISKSNGYKVVFSTEAMSIYRSVPSTQVFTTKTKSNDYSFCLRGGFYCFNNVTEERINDPENFYIESVVSESETLQIDGSIVDEGNGDMAIKYNIKNCTENISALTTVATVKYKLLPGWSEKIYVVLNLYRESDNAFAFIKNQEGTGAMLSTCLSIDENLEIPSKATVDGTELDVLDIGYRAFRNCSNLKSVKLPDTLLNIGQDAFTNCINLNNLTIPKSVKLLNAPFLNCSNLTNFTIDSENENYTNIGPDGKNYNCIFKKKDGVATILEQAICNTIVPSGITKLEVFAFKRTAAKKITIPSTVKSIMSWAFVDSDQLETIEFEANSNDFTLYHGTFQNCSGLKNIDLTPLSGLKKIQYDDFINCVSLENIKLPDSITTIESNAFNNCISLKEITLPASLTSFNQNIFTDCLSLQSIKIGANPTKFTTQDEQGNECNCLMDKNHKTIYFGSASTKILSSIQTISESAFAGRAYLEKVEIPDDSALTSIGQRAFQKCSFLTEINLPNNLTTIGSFAFDHCLSLKSIKLPQSLTTLGERAFTSCYSLESVDFNSCLIKSIPKQSFQGCLSLTKIDLSGLSQLTSIVMDAFDYCAFVKEAKLPSQLTTLDQYAFDACYSLQSINLEDTQVTSIPICCFGFCYSLTSIKLPTTVTSIEKSAFRNCVSLTSVDLSGLTALTALSDSVFSECSSLSNVTLPTNLTSIGKYTFDRCESLTSIEMPTTVTTISEYAFRGTGLQNVTIPANVTEISNCCFISCKNLKSVIFNGAVTKFGASAFNNCPSLDTITLPSTLATIGDECFKNSKSLTSITIPNSVTTIGNEAFVNSGLTSASFETATGWKYDDGTEVIGLNDPVQAATILLAGKQIKHS